jgi:HAD superfamily hydrolase (TIGR01484 family)
VLPIASLKAETARALEGVCFDVDDTVTRDGVLDASAYAALFALQAAGLTLIAVTGRPLGWAELIARMWPVHAAVGENGAGFIARRAHRLHFGYWDDEVTRARQTKQLEALRARVASEMPHVRVSNDSWARRCDLAFDVNEYERLPREDIDRLCDILASEGARTSVSSVHAHAQLGSHDKASGVARALSELFDVDETRARERFLFVGDSGNDAAAFAWFRTTAGVSNVSRHLDRLPCPPMYVASQSHGAGFAEIAELLLQRRQS